MFILKSILPSGDAKKALYVIVRENRSKPNVGGLEIDETFFDLLYTGKNVPGVALHTGKSKVSLFEQSCHSYGTNFFFSVSRNV